jgi:hypothetical protein
MACAPEGKSTEKNEETAELGGRNGELRIGFNCDSTFCIFLYKKNVSIITNFLY